MYILGDVHGSNRKAFDALEGTFGSQEFSAVEAVVALQNILGVNEEDATRLVKELVRSGTIKEV